MTQQEKQEIIAAVLDALRTNSKSIAQLTSVTELQDSDLIEVAGGRRVSYGTVKSLLGTIFDDSIDDKLDVNNELYFSESGRLRSTKATCVVLKSMGSTLDNAFNDSLNQWSYIASVGDTYYDATTKKIVYYKAVGSLISSDPDGGLVYCNAHTGATYRWKGSDWEQVGGMGNDISVVNDLTTGGGDKALSAEMGKRLKAKIEEAYQRVRSLYSLMSGLAFTDAKPDIGNVLPDLDWGNPKHAVTLSLNLSNAVVKHNGVAKSNNDTIQVEEGSGLTLTIEPASGYALTGAPTVSVGGNSVTPTDNSNGTYSVSIASVDADMTLSITATATQVQTEDVNLTIKKVTAYGAQYNTNGNTGSSTNGVMMTLGNLSAVSPECSLSSTAYAAGSPYNATINPASGYSIFSVKVTLNSQDITGEAYNPVTHTINVVSPDSSLSIVIVVAATTNGLFKNGSFFGCTQGSMTLFSADKAGQIVSDPARDGNLAWHCNSEFIAIPQGATHVKWTVADSAHIPYSSNPTREAQHQRALIWYDENYVPVGFLTYWDISNPYRILDMTTIQTSPASSTPKFLRASYVDGFGKIEFSSDGTNFTTAWEFTED